MEHKKIISNYDLQVDIGKKIFLDYDQEMLIRRFGLAADEAWIYLTYMNTPCRICRKTGRIEEALTGSFSERMSFLQYSNDNLRPFMLPKRKNSSRIIRKLVSC